MIARVIVDIVASQIDRVFDYRIPAALAGKCVPGCRVMVPFGPRVVEGFVMEVTPTSEVPENRLRDLGGLLDDQPALHPDLVDLARWMKGHTHCLLVEALQVMLPAQMRGGRVREKTVRVVQLAVGEEAALEKAQVLQRRAPQQAAVLRALAAAGGLLPLAALLQQAPGARPAVHRLQELSLLQVVEEESLRRPHVGQDHTLPPQCLTPEQATAVERIDRAVRAGKPQRFLLHGVTGSGKTEVYMAAAQEALATGRGVIILVPEIALTPQMVARFAQRFGDEAAVLHSRLSPGERFDEWRRIRRGDAHVVVGARSAIFAPLACIGLIVVDEEHELSYRSEHAPRYDALAVAAERCRQHGATLVLGSATPTVSRYYEALQGEPQLLRLPRRVGGLPMPHVSVVDMREELKAGNRSPISAPLLKALQDCLRRGDQAILFLNRRGYATFVSCRACGYVCQCEYCDLAMTYHRSGNRLVCHYCGHEQPVPKTCPACGSPYIRYFGGGTQKVEEEVARLLPDARLLRMDADTTRGKDGHAQLLEAFALGQAQVLIGTQMVAKGLDFPNVTLVGVLAADLSLHLPDWRAAERTFQLVAQVSGRAGRERPGQVVVQTYSPDHYAIQAACRHDYEAFYEEEIALRERAQFAPFAQILRVLVSHEDQTSAIADVAHVVARMEEALRTHPAWRTSILLMEASTSAVERIRGLFRAQLLLKIYPQPYGRDIEGTLADIAAAPTPKGASCVLEVDPVGML